MKDLSCYFLRRSIRDRRDMVASASVSSFLKDDFPLGNKISCYGWSTVLGVLCIREEIDIQPYNNRDYYMTV